MKNEIITFGCRLNSYESEVIKKNAELAGLSNTIIFNTCAVTKEAERQAKQAIRKAKKNSPDSQIIVTGCAAQINPGQFSSMPEVDKIIGNQEKLESKNFSLKLGEEKIIVNDIMSVKETAGHLISHFEGKARAYVQIQNGCNHRCTFCTIPFGRGNSRSVPLGEIVTQIKELVKSGYNEVVLTGVDITDYGLDLPATPNFTDMIKRVLKLVPELPRLRISSIDVAELGPDFIELIAIEKRIMPHIHISLQAGDNMILKRMKRRHTREQVIEFCKKVRDVREDVLFGADIIAGFPTENDEMFQNTYNLVKEANLQFLHVFPYSSRAGTPAAKMPQLPLAIRKERAKMLRDLGSVQLEEFMDLQIGKTLEIIAENNNSGKSENYLHIEFDKILSLGAIARVKITHRKEHILFGEVA